MDDILLNLKSVLQHDILMPLKHELKAEQYDTDSILYDISDLDEAQSCLHHSCIHDPQIFRELQQTITKYVRNNKSHTFKDMDFALSQYYALMGRDDYYNEHHIGAFEIFCYHNGYIREQEFQIELQKPAHESILSTFDLKHFPLPSNLSSAIDIENEDTRRHEIRSVLRNCVQNKHCYSMIRREDHTAGYSNCGSVTLCRSVIHVCNALQFHARTEDKKQLYEYFTQQYPHIVKDFHHILMKHLHSKDKLQNNAHFERIHNLISQNVNCNITKCNPFTRNNRNRERKVITEAVHEDVDDVLEYEYYVDLLDNIHCYFIHSYDTGFRLNTDLNHEIYDSGDNTDFDFDCNDVEQLYVDDVVKKLKVYLRTKQKNINNQRTNTNKFVTTVHQNKPKQAQMDSETQTKPVNKASEYAFGVRFYYWEWFKNSAYKDWRNKGSSVCEWYIEQKYNNFKEEMLNCDISMKDFDGVKLKATKLLTTSNVLKAMKSDFYYNANCRQLIHYGIPCGEPLKVSNVMAALFYTDFSTLSYEFSASFRRLYPTESDEALKERHREYFHWGKWLRETVELYGEYVHKCKTERFYHGVSFMYFDNFVTTFCAPTSTTAQLSVATIFSQGTGLVLELQQMPGIYSGNLKYFDCSLLSCYGNEDERLFFGGFQNLQFVSIHLMEQNQNMRWFIESLALFAKVVKGWKLRKEHKLAIKKAQYRIIEELIKQRIDSEYQNRFPEYINECFMRFCHEKRVIRFDIDALQTHYPGLYSEFMTSGDSDGVEVLKCDRIAQIFCNAKYIKVYFKEEITEKYLDGLLPMIGNLNTYKCALRVMVFTGEWTQNIIKSKQQIFAKLNWKIYQNNSKDNERSRQFGTKRLVIEKI